MTFRRDRYGHPIPDGQVNPTPYYVTIPMGEYEALQRIAEQVKASPATEDELAFRNIRSSLEKARSKHPDFCGDLVANSHIYCDAKMKFYQGLNDSMEVEKPSAEFVILEEFWEAMEAASAGRWADAYLEAAQCAATLQRFMIECAFQQRRQSLIDEAAKMTAEKIKPVGQTDDKA